MSVSGALVEVGQVSPQGNHFSGRLVFIICVKTGDATIATVRDHCETVVEVLLGGDLRPVDTRHHKLYQIHVQPNSLMMVSL